MADSLLLRMSSAALSLLLLLLLLLPASAAWLQVSCSLAISESAEDVPMIAKPSGSAAATLSQAAALLLLRALSCAAALQLARCSGSFSACLHCGLARTACRGAGPGVITSPNALLGKSKAGLLGSSCSAALFDSAASCAVSAAD